MFLNNVTEQTVLKLTYSLKSFNIEFQMTLRIEINTEIFLKLLRK